MPQISDFLYLWLLDQDLKSSCDWVRPQDNLSLKVSTKASSMAQWLGSVQRKARSHMTYWSSNPDFSDFTLGIHMGRILTGGRIRGEKIAPLLDSTEGCFLSSSLMHEHVPSNINCFRISTWKLNYLCKVLPAIWCNKTMEVISYSQVLSKLKDRSLYKVIGGHPRILPTTETLTNF